MSAQKEATERLQAPIHKGWNTVLPYLFIYWFVKEAGLRRSALKALRQLAN